VSDVIFHCEPFQRVCMWGGIICAPGQRGPTFDHLVPRARPRPRPTGRHGSLATAKRCSAARAAQDALRRSSRRLEGMAGAGPSFSRWQGQTHERRCRWNRTALPSASSAAWTPGLRRQRPRWTKQ